MAHILDKDNRNRLSKLVSEQLPEFIKGDHTTLVAFIEAYYEYLEQNQKPIEMNRNLRLYNDIDMTLDSFVDYFKKNYLVDIPDTILADKRTFLKNVREFYKGKGTDKSFILLFRMLFNETAEIYYPKVDMLKASDGIFTSETVLNLKSLTGDVTQITGQLVTQPNNKNDANINLATATIESVVGFVVGANQIYRLTLTDNTLAGNFIAGQTVTITGQDDSTITGVVDSIITGVTTTNDGNYYTQEDALASSGGSGSSAAFDIEATGKGGVNDFLIDIPGSKYKVGDPIAFANTGVGAGSIAEVSRVQNAFLLENGSDFINLESGEKILEETSNIVLEGVAPTQIHLEDGDNLLTEDGKRIIADTPLNPESLGFLNLETGHRLLSETNPTIGAVRDINIVNTGSNYTTLPTVSVTSTTGTGAVIYAKSNDIGKITSVNRTNVGTNYTSAPTITPLNNLILKNVTGGSFVQGNTLTTLQSRITLENGDSIKKEDGDFLNSEDTSTVSGTILSIDTNRALYKVTPASTSNFTGTLRVTNGSGVSAVVEQNDIAVLTPTVGTVSVSEGTLIGSRGRLSESSKKIQDSKYYQEFSYVIKVGQSVNEWRDAVKRILHPVGLAVFGEVAIRTSLKATLYKDNYASSLVGVGVNSTSPRYKQIQALLQATVTGNNALIPTTPFEKIELEIMAEAVKVAMFPTRLLKEDMGGILLEDSNVDLSGQGQNFLRGEDEYVGTEPGAVVPQLIFPRAAQPFTNIDATILMLDQINILLKNIQVDTNVNVPNFSNIPTRTKSTPEILIQAVTKFGDLVENAPVVTLQKVVEILKQLNVSSSVGQNVVTLLLPTIQSSQKLQVTFGSGSRPSIHTIEKQLTLLDDELAASFGSAKMGTSGYTLERMKFLFPPYSAGVRSIDRGGRINRSAYTSTVLTSNYSGSNTSNNTYWDTHGNTAVKDFPNVTVDDVVNFPGRKLDFAIDSEVFLRSS